MVRVAAGRGGHGAGSVIWDGVSQTQPFADLVGSPGAAGGDGPAGRLPGGLLAGLVLRVAQARRAWPAMGAGLVPVAVGYLVAHYLGYLLVEGQRIVVALSDPLQQGWDLLGTATWEPRDDVAADLDAVDAPGRGGRPGPRHGGLAGPRRRAARAPTDGRTSASGPWPRSWSG